MELRERSIKNPWACWLCTESWIDKEKLQITWWRNYCASRRKIGIRDNSKKKQKKKNNIQTGKYFRVAIKILICLPFNFDTLISLVELLALVSHKNYSWWRKLFEIALFQKCFAFKLFYLNKFSSYREIKATCILPTSMASGDREWTWCQSHRAP